jgi:hypothetical protein
MADMCTEPTFERAVITFCSDRLTLKVESSGHGQPSRTDSLYAICDAQNQYPGDLQVTGDVKRISEFCRAHDFEHGIVDGKIIDGVSAASIHANRLQKGEQLADIQTPDKTQDAVSGASVEQ